MASPINALTSGIAGSTTNGTNPATNTSQQVFLQLLVKQLQNQDPMNPTDSTQFVSELAQFSQLEQVIGIRGDIESYHAEAAAQTAATQTPAPGQTKP